MRIAFALSFLMAAPLAAAQTTHQVTVRSFEFDPASLEIQPGDTVEWTNEGGRHNVAEREPNSMPDGFGNEPSGEAWTYSFTFEEVGDYRYQCDPHAGLMQGEVFVRSVLSNEGGPLAAGALRLSSPVPNPTVASTRFSLTSGSDGRAEVTAYDLLGRRVATLFRGPVVAGRPVSVSLDAAALGLPAGAYVVRAEAGAARVVRKVAIVGR
jgi:plastocyanin